ncbi:protein adenylyltransferase SelO [Brevibacillus agri]
MTQAIPEAGWHFDNSYATLPETFFTRLNPTPVRSPKLVIFNRPLAAALGLQADALDGEAGAEVFAGNRIPPGAKPIAQAYAGHQFGQFTMLGDGRALLMGEHITPQGERFDLQWKGSGRTPYSRRGDGRAALGPMLREYIISEAMHGLGIPTTRSLAVVTTGETVIREDDLPGAVLMRVASSHLRVGTFQYAAQWGSDEELRALADYTLQRHFPQAAEQDNRYLALLEEVIRGQAELIAKWQLVGFVHGVMNTDNMSICGETIDYGPCAFMDTYDPATVFSSIDYQGRYAYGNQPQIAVWNLARFAEALLPLVDENQAKAVQVAQDALSRFGELYYRNWLAGMRAKLGLFGEEADDVALMEELLNLLQKHRADYTNTFLALTFDQQRDEALFAAPEFAAWQEKWQARQKRHAPSDDAVRQRMKASNPALIPRNHRVEAALEAAVQEGDYSVLERLVAALVDPYAHSPEQAEYATLPPDSCGPYRTYCGT